MRGACDRYANQGGQLVRVDAHVLLERTVEQGGKLVPFLDRAEDWDGRIVSEAATFVTAIGAGTTYPDYKPAPFIVSSEVDGVDMVTVVTEGIFSYCGVKVKIDTDRHLGPETAAVRVDGEQIGHVTTAEYGSQMLSLGGVHHLTGGSKKEGRVTCEALLALCNGKPVEATVDGGATVVIEAGKAPIINGVPEDRMRVGCGSATIGMFAKQWLDHVDEVVVVDDHITGVLSEHQAGKFLGVRDTGIKIKGHRSTPGRYFKVAHPGTGWGGTDLTDPLAILKPFDKTEAWPGLRLLDGLDHRRALRLFRTGRSLRTGAEGPAAGTCAFGRAHRRELRAGPVHGAVHGRCRRLAARRRHRKSGAADQIGEGRADPRHLRRRPCLCLAGRRHHLHGRCDEASRQCLRLCADPGAGRAHRVHHDARRLSGAWRPHGSGRDGWMRSPPFRANRAFRLSAEIPGRWSAAMTRMQERMLPDGKRLHLQDGPIDLIVGADGEAEQVARAYDVARIRFSTILDELCTELPLLRQPTRVAARRCQVARRMWRATADLARETFITPMAAVAGAVAEEVLYAMVTVATLERAHVNNGGDIAIHLGPWTDYDVGLVDRPENPSLFTRAHIDWTDAVRGIATSGWRGRSFSLGIADAVTVLAVTASVADAAATLIANAVDLPGHPAITPRARQ